MTLLLHSSTGETFEYDGENLYHFSVKGMKWGIRRYQNPDGSLTPEGKRRYAKYEKRFKKANARFNKLRKKADQQVKLRESLRKNDGKSLLGKGANRLARGATYGNEAIYNLASVPSAFQSVSAQKKLRQRRRK